MSELKNCKICGKLFESENGIVSCEEHSFGEVEDYVDEDTPTKTDKQ